jgi:hypothetical protein
MTVYNPNNNVTVSQITDGSIAYSDIQNVSATSKVLGRISSGEGVIEEITFAQAATASSIAQRDSNEAITSTTNIKTGASDTNKEYTANSGASITIDPANGYRQTITLTANTTITLTTVPSSTTNRSMLLELVQDGTGGRTVSWSNITFATTGAVAPAINTAASASTFILVDGINSHWVGFAANQNLGVKDASSAAAGYIGEVITSSVAIGSATSLTTATAKTITSISLTPGDWMVSGNIGFIAASGTLPTILTASVSSTDNTQATSPNGGGFTQFQLSFSAASTNVLPLTPTRINITSTTTYYLVATATFTVSTLTAYGSITARRFR